MARTVGKLKGLWSGILDNSSLAAFYNKLKLAKDSPRLV